MPLMRSRLPLRQRLRLVSSALQRFRRRPRTYRLPVCAVLDRRSPARPFACGLMPADRRRSVACNPAALAQSFAQPLEPASCLARTHDSDGLGCRRAGQRLPQATARHAKSWIRDEAYESKLGQGAGGPRRAGAASKPAMRRLMMFVCGPDQGRQNIDVEECRHHGRSSPSWSMRAVVTFGERRERRSTRSPLRSSVTSGRSAALLTRSLTAWPRVSLWRCACACATFIASSSS